MEEFIMTQEAFDRLWQRVQGAEAVPTRRNVWYSGSSFKSLPLL